MENEEAVHEKVQQEQQEQEVLSSIASRGARLSSAGIKRPQAVVCGLTNSTLR